MAMNAPCLDLHPDNIFGFSFWDAAGAQQMWESLFDWSQAKFGDDSFWSTAAMTVGVSYVCLLAIYWGLGTLLMPFDFWVALHSKVLKVKCQPRRRMTYKMVTDICSDVFVQHLTVYPLFLLLGVPVLKARLDFDRRLPSYKTVSWQLPVFLFFTELWFYYVHRALHHKSVYRYVHKKHHKYTYPLALECLYFHPVESVLNFGVVGLGPLMCGSHVVMLYLWTCVTLTAILIHHCGYEIPFDDLGWGSMTQLHDFHHAKFSVNFGVVGWLDAFHRTDQGFAEHMEDWKAARENGSTEWQKDLPRDMHGAKLEKAPEAKSLKVE